MKKKALLTTTRSLLGREGNGLIYHFKFIESLFDEIYYVSNNKTLSGIKQVKETINVLMKNIFFDVFDDTSKMKDWMEVYEWLDVSMFKDYDCLFIVGGLDMPSNKLSKAYLPDNEEKIFPNSKVAIKFKQSAISLTKILLFLKIHNEHGIPLHEIAFDPVELTCDYLHNSVRPIKDYVVYHGYDVSHYNIKRLDSLQYYFLNKSTAELPIDNVELKKFDFTFGYHIMNNSSRNKFNVDVDEIVGLFAPEKRNLFCNNKITGIDTSVKKEVYLNFIKASNYTFILPAYDETCFSIYRFIESLWNDCLPLLHTDCNIEDVNTSFGVDLSVLKRNQVFSENERNDLLRHFKSKFFNDLVLI